MQSHSTRNRRTVPRVCAECGRPFLADGSNVQKGQGHCCSTACAIKHRTTPPADRFWSKVNKTESCWLWTAASSNKGYGVFGADDQRRILAHRYSWELAHGPIPDGLLVCHRCDTPLCVRPDHLFLGTYEENMADCKAKGRTARGARSGARLHPESCHRGEDASWSIFTAAQVIEIRNRYADGEVQEDIAADFGVSQSHISKIVLRRIWRSVL